MTARALALKKRREFFLHQEFSVSYTQAGVCLLFQRLKIKAKEPRPENIKAEKAAQDGYKKTSDDE